MKRLVEERSRDRVLADNELIAIWRAIEATPYPFGPWYAVRLLTAQRRQETAGMQWVHLDLDKATWILPGAETKNDERHIVPLPQAAVDVLRGQPRTTSPYVFTTNGRTPISGFSKADSRLYAKAMDIAERDDLQEIAAWTAHDWRRTASTVMAANAVPLQAAELLLNHKAASLAGVAQVYNRYSYGSEKRQAVEIWARHIHELVNPPPKAAVPDNVVPIPDARS